MRHVAGRIWTAVWHTAYGAYAWLVFLVTVICASVIAIVVPGLERRRRWITAAARTFVRLAGVPATVSGEANLPADHCIVVANHASYLDGVILQAFLPPRFSFVIKGEMQRVPVMHFVLRRIGAKFVERFVAAGSARDARALIKAAAAGESLTFFPEGTFLEAPGLSRFRPGAFAAAIKGELPLVPVVIRGSRQILPARTMMPRRGRLKIDILQAIDPADPAFGNSALLAELARQRILTVLDEPDLHSRTASTTTTTL